MKLSESQRYPVGRFTRVSEPIDAASRAALIEAIERAPGDIRALVAPLTDAQLEPRRCLA